MTTEEIKKFLQEDGVSQTLEMIFNKAKEVTESGNKFVDVVMPDMNTASKFNQVISSAGYTSAIVVKDGVPVILIYI